jgi:tRNA nucleotidyltransferase (CCA-adding enzyme)
MKNDFQIPKEVIEVTKTLEKAGFEAFIVGGCVRDLILGRTPKDWDVTTNAAQIKLSPYLRRLFTKMSFGTVGVVNEETANESL